MFKTKIFTVQEISDGRLDAWLNNLQLPGYGVRIASQVAINVSVMTTISIWKLGENPQASVRSTIDEIPEEPTISLS